VPWREAPRYGGGFRRVRLPDVDAARSGADALEPALRRVLARRQLRLPATRAEAALARMLAVLLKERP